MRTAVFIACLIWGLATLGVIGLFVSSILHSLRGELVAQRDGFVLEREAWATERAGLLTRCMDPSLVAALAPTGLGEPEQTGLLSEDEETVRHRQEVAQAIHDELAARAMV